MFHSRILNLPMRLIQIKMSSGIVKFLFTSRNAAAAAAKSLQSYPTLCDPRDGSPLSLRFSRQEHWSGVHFLLQWKWKVKVKSLSHIRFFVTPWTVAYQAPLSMGFSRQEHWSGVPLSSPSRDARHYSHCI